MDTFEKLKKFISQDMQMSHIYQPVMLIELLKHKGKASVTQIAQAILNRDPSQIEYYSEVVKKMPGDVLTRKRGITTKEGHDFCLNAAGSLSQSEKEELVQLCEGKIAEYEVKRQGAHWEHRRRGRRPVSGSIRWQVLNRAKTRCESCGISNEEKNLEVDHIVPRSWSGKNDISNYQALCYTCNAQKNNKDSTNFHELRTQYDHREVGCLFCDIQTKETGRILSENNLGYATRDGFPVTVGHTLLIPKRHVLDYFGLTQAEVNALNQLVSEQKKNLESEDKTIEGFNIGVNCGETAGQSVFHCHVHLIPRRKGDVESPKGGVRHVIPHKGHYEVGK